MLGRVLFNEEGSEAILGEVDAVLEVVIGEGEVVDIVDHTRIRTSHVNRRNWLQFGHSSAMNSIIVYFRYLDVLDNHKEVRIRSFLKYFVSFFFYFTPI
uniref:Uncharacterized protein n=1 Tax=Angiostrongylus cantonensis TaxID=6313 RepID=C7BVV6_ANGCA|nr:hypothetical protein [Angiostrongylus cantonensis]